MPSNINLDVICNDLTRVVVADGRGSDYIHANYVRGEPLFNEFVCTQGPTPATLNDFWRMILHIRVGYSLFVAGSIDYFRPLTL